MSRKTLIGTIRKDIFILYIIGYGEIRLRVEQPEQRLKVLVWNEGPGFRLSEQSRLFRKFSRLTTPELLQQKGGGVALYTAWRIIQLHRGRLGAKSEHGKWAEFYFEIPQPLGADTSAEDSIGRGTIPPFGTASGVERASGRPSGLGRSDP